MDRGLSPALALLLLVPACDPGEVETAHLALPARVCAAGPTLPGIDVARWQGEINWQSVAGSGVVFAFIQISRAIDDIDVRFESNWAQAKAAGVLRGAYQRFQPHQDVNGQADLFLAKLAANGAGELPPVLDVEDTGGLGPAAIASAVRQWMDRVEPVVGVKPIIYTGKYFWQDKVGGADFTDHGLWIAQWSVTCPDLPSPWTGWQFHQTSATGRVPGISGDVDLNLFNGTREELLALAAGGGCGEDCEPCQLIPGSGGVIDDTGPCFRAGGDPRYIRQENAGYGSFLKWTHTTDQDRAANYGRWDLHLEEAGRYRVEAFTPAPWGQSRQAVYEIAHAGTTTAAEVDQSAHDGWNLVAELEFAEGGGQFIRVDDNTGEPNASETKLVFDAIRLTRVGGGQADGDGDGDSDGDGPGQDGEMAGGCAAAGGGAGGAGGAEGLAWLLALGLLLSQRARQCWVANLRR
jgi:GH25 family lysozyme M1 (1,4-beta-N-acetylmuramidase)